MGCLADGELKYMLPQWPWWILVVIPKCFRKCIKCASANFADCLAALMLNVFFVSLVGLGAIVILVLQLLCSGMYMYLYSIIVVFASECEAGSGDVDKVAGNLVAM